MRHVLDKHCRENEETHFMLNNFSENRTVCEIISKNVETEGPHVMLQYGTYMLRETDAGSSVISSDLKHRANDARDGSSSYSNRRDQNGLNGCCTAMWKANGKTTTLSLFLQSLFPKTDVLEEAVDL
jgi:hypothetical protein